MQGKDLITCYQGTLINVYRIMTTSVYPIIDLNVSKNKEIVIYPLIGEAELTAYDLLPTPIGGRMTIKEEPCPAWYGWFSEDTILTFHSQTMSFDFMIIESVGPISSNESIKSFGNLATPLTRDVGEHAYLRQVTDMRMTWESRIHVGETMSWNDGVRGGCWSSWPPHATQEEALDFYDQHEEIFLVITPGEGTMFQHGVLTDGNQILHEVSLYNNGVYHVPLGSHSVVFHPQAGPAWGWYFWAYHSFLKKTYNQHAHHVKTYVR